MCSISSQGLFELQYKVAAKILLYRNYQYHTGLKVRLRLHELAKLKKEDRWIKVGTFYRPLWWIRQLRQNVVHVSDVLMKSNKIFHELFSHTGPLRTLSSEDEVDFWDRFGFTEWRDSQRCPRARYAKCSMFHMLPSGRKGICQVRQSGRVGRDILLVLAHHFGERGWVICGEYQ